MWETALAFAIWGSYGSVLSCPLCRVSPAPTRAHRGVARTSICCFAGPLVATLCSLVVLKDAPATALLLTGVVLVLAGIAAAMRFSD